jgi:hypothetical protein
MSQNVDESSGRFGKVNSCYLQLSYPLMVDFINDVGEMRGEKESM